MSSNNYNRYFTYFVGKNKVQETMESFAPPIGFGSLVAVTTSLIWKLVTTFIACIGENFWEIVTSTLANLPIS
jgi:hypothetical protein